MDDLPAPRQRTFKRNAHVNYFLRCLGALPSEAQAQDANRITIAYFCLSALDLLGVLFDKTTAEQRHDWADWVWGLQAPTGGFRGSTYMNTPNEESSPAHLPSTYTALLVLALLRSPLDRLNIPGMLAFLQSCQGPDGSFSPLPGNDGDDTCFQNDMRMTYCATAISSFLDDFSGIDIIKAREFVARCRTWEGGYASRPGGIEAQGGTTYCALNSLYLLPSASPTSNPSSSPPSPSSNSKSDLDTLSTLRWLVQRQIGGFQGRPGKLEDVCYSFWIGGAISVLGQGELIDSPSNTTFLLSSQSPIGGFGKEPEDDPDPFHSYLALAALSLRKEDDSINEFGLLVLDSKWNVSVATRDWLVKEMSRVKAIHESL